ncbi:hypothetical protein A7K91_01225 [Paenibacillus oryzae]|uniref:HTH tetR-type domain-containing protein n=1 Tax=Paenibacillus oryzae TaxID=1844972 RepID=A0A1A5YA65_9BACL|nr:TetR family transcriptional regulator [Paenibacillus oryzae]OBR62275.1 hypothetical protein A7K91_01225 [Paenibacillus oryzae]
MPKVGVEPFRRAAVVNAALACICEKGTERITLDMVAEKAGCSKGVVAYYFKNKKGLVLESLKAFFSYYGTKIGHDISPGMKSAEMLRIIVDHSLPALGVAEEQHRPLNVSDLEGAERMAMSAEEKARLFIQFFGLAMTDQDARDAIRDIYGKDIEGISQLILYATQRGEFEEERSLEKSRESAYGLLALLVGLSVMRVTDVMPPGAVDNRTIALTYIEELLQEGK